MKKPASYVNPLIDTVNRRFLFMTTACRPFGMVNLSPDTRTGDAWQAGYRYGDHHICWFSHLHAWQLCGIPVMPTMGTCKGHLGPDTYRSRFDHVDEIAQPGFHQVTLKDYEIRAELTATTRVGFHRYTFGQPGKAPIIFDLGAAISLPMSDVCAVAVGRRCLEGYVENAPTRRRPKPCRIYFVADFDHDWKDCQVWQFGQKPVSGTSIEGAGSGIAPIFNVAAGEQIQLKVAISYCSVDHARKNLDAELAHWDFDRVRQEAFDEWNQRLSRIEVHGGTENRKVKFYTDLYHALKGRRRVSDVGGTYCDHTGPEPVIRQIPLGPDGKPLYEHHNSDAFWGAPWALNGLWPLVCPDIVHNFCHMFLDYYRNGGLIPRGPSGGNYTYVMTSPTSTTFMVTAWMKGIRTFDPELAFEGLLKNHGPGGLMSKAGYEHDTCTGGGVEYYLERGYVPTGIPGDAFHRCGGTQTLEYAYHDWCLAQFASSLGKLEQASTLLQRSTNWRNLWDENRKSLVPRQLDGSFLHDYDPLSPEGWVEGNGWQYMWMVPHDVAGLAACYGGFDAFNERLNQTFELAKETNFVAPHAHHHESVLDYGNQPSTYIAHLFNHTGAPELAQKWVREIVLAAKSDTTPAGGFSGDEDQGMMGSLNALMTMGLFDVKGGCDQHPSYELTSPFFETITLHLDPQYYPGRTFTIEASGAGEHHATIKSASFNGKPLPSLFLPHADLINGGTLNLELS